MTDKDKKGDQSDNDVTKSLEGLNKVFGDMTKQLQELPKQVSMAVAHGLGEVMQQQAAGSGAADDDDDDEGDDPVGEIDLEKMSRAEFANAIMKQFNKSLSKTLKPLEDRLNTTGETAERERVAQRFAAVRKEYSDFDEWKQEMGELVKTRGYLDPEELYIIAKAKHPEKAKQLAEAAAEKEKAEKEQQSGEGESQDRRERPSFLGLMPTNSGGGQGEGDAEYKTTKDAAEAAFDEILGGVSDDVLGEANAG